MHLSIYPTIYLSIYLQDIAQVDAEAEMLIETTKQIQLANNLTDIQVQQQ